MTGPGSASISPETSEDDSASDDDGQQPIASDAISATCEADESLNDTSQSDPPNGDLRPLPQAWDWVRGSFRAPPSRPDLPNENASKGSAQHPPEKQNEAASSASVPARPLEQIPRLENLPQRHELQTKIISQICRELSSGAFFYSYDMDLTHTLQYKRGQMPPRRSTTGHESEDKIGKPADNPRLQSVLDDFIEPDLRLPLWRRVDRQFFWNESMLSDFLDLGLNSFILPVMQGWVQSATFHIPAPLPLHNAAHQATDLETMPIDLVVISRRSRDRAGLRYQRRGIDDNGHVANLVETEMVVRAKVKEEQSVHCAWLI